MKRGMLKTEMVMDICYSTNRRKKKHEFETLEKIRGFAKAAAGVLQKAESGLRTIFARPNYVQKPFRGSGNEENSLIISTQI